MTQAESNAVLANLLGDIEKNQHRRTRTVNLLVVFWLALLVASTVLSWWRLEALYSAHEELDRRVQDIAGKEIEAAKIANAKELVISAWMFDGEFSPVRNEINLLRDAMSEDDAARHFQRFEEYLWRGAVLWRDRKYEQVTNVMTTGLDRFDRMRIDSATYDYGRLLRGWAYTEEYLFLLNVSGPNSPGAAEKLRLALDDLNAILDQAHQQAMALSTGEETSATDEDRHRIRRAGLDFHIRGVLRLMAGSDEGALTDFEIATGMRSYPTKSTGSLENISLVYLRQGDWSAARENSEAVVQLVSETDRSEAVWNWLFLAISYLKLEDLEAADVAFGSWLDTKRAMSEVQVKWFLTPELIEALDELKKRHDAIQREATK